MGETFVNPYTFVPFPEVTPHRCAPQGHLGRGDMLSGRVAVTITAETPLLVRGITPSEDDETALPCRPDGTPMIPGSSLKGALRSLHETLVGGCLRVFDHEFVPGYRDPASPESIGTVRMAVVKNHDDEKTPPVLQLCDDDAKKPRLHQDELARLHREEGPLISGDRLRVRFDERGKPVEAHRDDGGEWVVFLTDAKARKKYQPYRAHIRKLPADAEERKVPDDVWDDFRAALEGVDDLRTARLRDRDEHHPFADVTFTYQPKGKQETEYVLGKRHLADFLLRPGQPVWVRMGGNEITALRLAMVWRHPGRVTAEERVNHTLLPCRDDQDLCPSCRLFGSADTDGKDTAAAQQRSYRGHVRIGDALAIGEVAPQSVTLPPMGLPRPGAGQFYLVNDADTRGNASEKPLREWGSAADAGGRERRLRGRKYYWHTPLESAPQPRRGKARPHQLDKSMTTRAAVFPRGTRFTTALTFTDLDKTQLGGLLACLQPGALLGERLWQHIGGGRPLGYGSCTLELDLSRSAVWRSGARYGAAGNPISFEPARFLEVFREWMRRELPEVQRTWRLVAKVLRPNAVDPAKVWYPPGASWDQLGGKAFDEGYEFWKRTRGMEMRSKGGVRTGHPLTPLPDLDSPDQSLPLIPKSGARKDEDTAETLPAQRRHPHDSQKGKRP